jgi:hypothetical protein
VRLAGIDLRAAAFQGKPDFESAYPNINGLRLPFGSIGLSLLRDLFI